MSSAIVVSTNLIPQKLPLSRVATLMGNRNLSGAISKLVESARSVDPWSPSLLVRIRAPQGLPSMAVMVAAVSSANLRLIGHRINSRLPGRRVLILM